LLQKFKNAVISENTSSLQYVWSESTTFRLISDTWHVT